MRKILFIIQSYPSERSANVLCDEKIMKELLKTGEYEVHCLCYRYADQPLYEEINGIKVHRWKRGLWWRIFSQASFRKMKFSKFICKLDRIFLRLKQFITIPIYPCYEPCKSLKCARTAIDLQKEEKFDVVVAEHNGSDTLYGGYRLKKAFPNIKFAPILWDPIDGCTLAKYLPKNMAQKKVIKAENKLLKNADVIFALDSIENYHKEHSTQKSYFYKFKFLGIPGIIEHEKASNKSDLIDDGMINIVFTGLLSLPMRDPEPIIKIFNKTKMASKLNLIFICSGDGREKLKELKHSFQGNIVISDYIKNSELPAVYQYADVLLNFGGNNSTMVPSKIFEYISYGKPIISTYYIDNEASISPLKKYSNSLLLDERDDVEKNTVKLENFIEHLPRVCLSKDKILSDFKNNTPESYVNVIQELFD